MSALHHAPKLTPVDVKLSLNLRLRIHDHHSWLLLWYFLILCHWLVLIERWQLLIRLVLIVGTLGIFDLRLRCVLSERIEKSRMLLGNSGLEHLHIFQARSIQPSFLPYVMAFTSLLIDIICVFAIRVDAVVQSSVPPRVRDRCASWLRVLAL